MVAHGTKTQEKPGWGWGYTGQLEPAVKAAEGPLPHLPGSRFSVLALLMVVTVCSLHMKILIHIIAFACYCQL